MPARSLPFTWTAPPERERAESWYRYLPKPEMPVSMPFAQLRPVAHGIGVTLKSSEAVGTVMLIVVRLLVWWYLISYFSNNVRTIAKGFSPLLNPI